MTTIATAAFYFSCVVKYDTPGKKKNNKAKVKSSTGNENPLFLAGFTHV